MRRAVARLCAVLAACLVLAACTQPPRELRFEGPTMGTTYHVTVTAPPAGVGREQLQQDIDRVLARVDELMSTWRPDSEISRLNASPPGEWFPLAPETHAVLSAALAMHRES